MVIDDFATCIDGYYCIMNPRRLYMSNEMDYISVLQYSPIDGSELEFGFMYELQCLISSSLLKRNDNEIQTWMNHMSNKTPAFSISAIPQYLRFLLDDKNWYYKRKQRDRKRHCNGRFCGEMSGSFIEDCYSYSDNELPAIARLPIKYCPFCGIALPPEFQQKNWWDKEFKNFDWYKKHKMYEWADDYVDDHDWEYPDE